MSESGISLTTKVRRTDTVFSSSVGDDLVIFDHEKGVYYGAGTVGEAIWTMMSEARRIDELCDRLMDEFDVDRPTCESEVQAFVQDLVDSGLAQVVTR